MLLVAPTNTGVDIALQGALTRLGRFRPGQVVRAGQPSDISLVDRADGNVLIEEIAAVRGVAVGRAHGEVSKQIRKLQAEQLAVKRDPSGHRRRLSDIQLELAEASAYAKALKGLMGEVKRQVRKDARLVAATAHQLAMTTLSGLRFDAVVVDEASMLPASLTMLAAGAGHGHTVVAGDFRQLRPVVLAESGPAHDWLYRSAFGASGIASKVTSATPPTNLVALNVQHRMAAAVADAVSAGFDPENPLITAGSVLTRSPGSIDDDPDRRCRHHRPEASGR